MTLIELLLVLAILAMLAGLLLPVFTSARDKGRQAVCLSNLKQLGAAFAMYVGDWNGYPDSGVFGSGSGGWVVCPVVYGIQVDRGSLFPYLRSLAVYRCPAEVAPRPLSYAMNLFMALRSEASVEAPSDALLLIEESDRSPRNDGAFDPRMAWDRLTDRHAGGGNVNYCDGHARWRPANSLDREWGGTLPAAFTGGGS